MLARYRCPSKTLDEVERDRTAATLAWLTFEAITNQHGPEDLAWHDFVANVLREHVRLGTSDGWGGEDPGAEWWSEAAGLAFMQFVRHNELAPSVCQHLAAMRARGGTSRSS